MWLPIRTLSCDNRRSQLINKQKWTGKVTVNRHVRSPRLLTLLASVPGMCFMILSLVVSDGVSCNSTLQPSQHCHNSSKHHLHAAHN